MVNSSMHRWKRLAESHALHANLSRTLGLWASKTFRQVSCHVTYIRTHVHDAWDRCFRVMESFSLVTYIHKIKDTDACIVNVEDEEEPDVYICVCVFVYACVYVYVYLCMGMGMCMRACICVCM